MVCFVDTYCVRYAKGNVEVLPPSDYDLFWITDVIRFGNFYSCCYRKTYPVRQRSSW